MSSRTIFEPGTSDLVHENTGSRDKHSRMTDKQTVINWS